MSNFHHLHVHSDFSCLDGYGLTSEYAAKAAKNSMKYLCITDHGMMAAIPRMIEECKKNEITPIFGCEFYTNNYQHLVPNFSSLSDDDQFLARKSYHLLLIAKNNIGYKNIVKMMSESWVNGFYYKPRISWDFLQKHAEGTICTSACLASEASQLILKEKVKEAIDFIKKCKDLWGEDFYLETQMINMKEQDFVNKIFLQISNKYQIPLVITNDVHYCEKEHSKNQQIMLLLNSKGTINNKGGGWEFHTDQLWYKTEDEMDELWQANYKDDFPESEYNEAKLNTYKICQKCKVSLDVSPKFPIVENAKQIMLDLCLESMKKKGLYNKKIYRDRLLREYSLICEKGFESYFMCVEKIVHYALTHDISVGPARGSGAGSLICFLLGITQVDPIKWNLLFERFLSPSRGGKFAKLQFPDSAEIK